MKHFTSWLGLCPNFKKTGGKVKSSRVRRGKNRAALALRLAAFSLIRSKSYLGAYLRRQRSRLGAPKAITAAAHKLARIVYYMMRFGVAYMKQTEDAYAEQVRAHGEAVTSPGERVGVRIETDCAATRASRRAGDGVSVVHARLSWSW